MRSPFRILFYSLLLCGSFYSCTKDIAPPIYTSGVLPGDYFPAYPGSYWVYNTGDSVIVDNNYHEYTFDTAGCTGQSAYQTLILPRLKANAVFYNAEPYMYINKYGYGSNARCAQAFFGLLNENLNGGIYLGSYFSGHQEVGLTVTKDTSIIVNSVTYDSVIVCIHYDRYSMFSPPQNFWTTREYFAKHVGLILRESRNSFPVDSTVYTDFSLVSYHIQ